jgi:protein SCO1/2
MTSKTPHCATFYNWLLVVGFCVPLVLVCAAIASATQAAGDSSPQNPSGLPPILRDVNFAPPLNGPIPLDLEFRDENARAVHLANYFHGKPVILALVYYRCPMLCDQVLEGLVSSLRVLTFNPGDKFEVVVVSFDPRENPAMAADKKQEIVGRYHRTGTENGWHFLTGTQSSIAALTQAAGFHYAWDAENNMYAHVSGILVLTPQGKISRYFYGIEYAPRDVRLGLVEASANKIGTPIDRLLLFCYHYDPKTGKYGALVINLVRGGGILTVLALGLVVFVFLRREKHSLAGEKVP